LPQKPEAEAVERDYPILEYDDTPEALIEPQRVIRPKDVPEHAVVCFFHEVIEGLCQQHGACIVHPMRSEMGLHPVYELKVEGKRLAIFHPGVGAPLAAGLLEEVIALGCRKFVARRRRGRAGQPDRPRARRRSLFRRAG
jgi:hypothetical protein